MHVEQKVSLLSIHTPTIIMSIWEIQCDEGKGNTKNDIG